MNNVDKINKKLTRVCKKLNYDGLHTRLYLRHAELVIFGFDDWSWGDLDAFKNKLERRGFVVDVFGSVDGDPSPQTPLKSFEDFYELFELVREKYISMYADNTTFTAADVRDFRKLDNAFFSELNDDDVRVFMALEDVAEPLAEEGRLFFECGSWYCYVSLRVKKCSKKTSKFKKTGC